MAYSGVGIDRFLELFEVAVGKTDVVVDVSFVSQIRLVHQRLLQSLYALLELIEGVIRQPKFVKHLRIVLVDFECVKKIFYRLCVLFHVVVALSPIHQETCIRRLFLNSPLKEAQCLFILLQRMVTTPLPVKHTSILLSIGSVQIQVMACLEVFYGFLVPSGLELGDSSPVVGIRELSVDFDGLVEVVDSELMIAHVLVDESSRNVHGFIFRQLLQHVTVALQCLMELVGSMVHLPEMEPAGYEILRQQQSLLIHFYGFLLQCDILPLWLFHRLALKCKTFRVPELWVAWGYGYRFVVVRVCVVVFLKVQIDITPVEVEKRILWILCDGFVIVAFCVFQSPDMVVS